jgi:hypothetical protein
MLSCSDQLSLSDFVSLRHFNATATLWTAILIDSAHDKLISVVCSTIAAFVSKILLDIASRAGGSNDVRRLACADPCTCMASLPWGVVIVDESHNLRTSSSRGPGGAPGGDMPVTEACCAAATQARRAILLTGTPSLRRPYDLYRQVSLGEWLRHVCLCSLSCARHV